MHFLCCVPACSFVDGAALTYAISEWFGYVFSQGLHKCPGERLALRTMECVVAQLLLRKVELEAPLPPVSFERATLAQRSRRGLARHARSPITARETDYSQWYLDVIREAELVDRGPVAGTMVLRPDGMALWEQVQEPADT